MEIDQQTSLKTFYQQFPISSLLKLCHECILVLCYTLFVSYFYGLDETTGINLFYVCCGCWGLIVVLRKSKPTFESVIYLGLSIASAFGCWQCQVSYYYQIWIFYAFILIFTIIWVYLTNSKNTLRTCTIKEDRNIS